MEHRVSGRMGTRLGLALLAIIALCVTTLVGTTQPSAAQGAPEGEIATYTGIVTAGGAPLAGVMIGTGIVPAGGTPLPGSGELVTDAAGMFTIDLPAATTSQVFSLSGSPAVSSEYPYFFVELKVDNPSPLELIELTLPPIVQVEVDVNNPAHPDYLAIDGEFEVRWLGELQYGERATHEVLNSEWASRTETVNGMATLPMFDSLDPDFLGNAVAARSLTDNSIGGQRLWQGESEAYVIVQGPPYLRYPDADGDQFGDADAVAMEDYLLPIVPGLTYVVNNGDCDDTNAGINPLAADVPGNGIDEDCNGEDAAIVARTFTGIVTAGGVPLSGVRVESFDVPAEAVTDADGNFEFELPVEVTEPRFRLLSEPETNSSYPEFDVDMAVQYAPEPVELILPPIIQVEVEVNNPAHPDFVEVEGEFEVFEFGELEFGAAGSAQVVASFWASVAETTNGKVSMPLFGPYEPVSDPVESAITARLLSDDSIQGETVWSGETDVYIIVQAPPYLWYVDADGDQFGDANLPPREFVFSDANYVANAGDCDDSSAAINPRASEVAGNGIDEDCDGEDAPLFCLGHAVTINMNLGASGVGTAGNDVILGTPGPDLIDGGDGDDLICSLGGDDVIEAGAGRDIVAAGHGLDIVHGGAGIDYIYGGQGADEIYGQGGSDRLFGGPGADEIHGGSGADRMFGGDGDDTMFGMGGRDFMWGDLGNDIMQGNHQSDVLFGGDGADVLRGARGKDKLYGEAGNDELYGGVNTDYLDGGSGIDTAFGQRGKDNPLVPHVSGCIAEQTFSC